jgi:hypothetical protein
VPPLGRVGVLGENRDSFYILERTFGRFSEQRFQKFFLPPEKIAPLPLNTTIEGVIGNRLARLRTAALGAFRAIRFCDRAETNR